MKTDWAFLVVRCHENGLSVSGTLWDVMKMDRVFMVIRCPENESSGSDSWIEYGSSNLVASCPEMK